MENKIEIVCSSYSKNINLWKELINSYKKFAPQIIDNFKFTIISDKVGDFNNSDGFYFFFLDNDYGWSENLIKYLNKTSSDYILIVFDDVFLNKKLDQKLFNQILEEYFTKKMEFCRFRNSPLTLKQSIFKNFNFVDAISPYRTVLSFSLVKKTVLLSLLQDNENAWDYEYNSPQRAKDIEIFETKKNLFNYIHVIEKGGYRFKCLFYKELKEIRENYNLFLPGPIYLMKFMLGFVFSKCSYRIKKSIYQKFKKLHN